MIARLQVQAGLLAVGLLGVIRAWWAGLPALTQRTEGVGVQVELDLFSDRVNPTWHLSADESSELLQWLQALPPAAGRTIQNELGYRGFIVMVPESERITVYEYRWQGYIDEDSDGATRVPSLCLSSLGSSARSIESA